MEINKTEIQALINLLDDNDEQIVNHVAEKLMVSGTLAIPYLEAAWENTHNEIHQQRIEDLLHQIQFTTVAAELKNWLLTKPEDLIEAFYIICKYEFPYLKKNAINDKLQKIKQDIWLELNDNLTPLEKIKVINHVFFDIHQFTGNTTDFHSPQNSFLNKVLETKKGNPLTLAVIYSSLAQMLDLPVFGVNLPEHFILCYLNSNEMSFIDKDQVLFYINPFNKGSVFTKKEIELFMKQINVDPNEYYYKPCSPIDIVKRLLINLTQAYRKQAQPKREKEMEELQKILG